MEEHHSNTQQQFLALVQGEIGFVSAQLLASSEGLGQWQAVRGVFEDDLDTALKVVFDLAHTDVDLRDEFFRYFWHQLPDGWLRGGFPSLRRHMDTDDLRVSAFRELKEEMGGLEFTGRKAFRRWLLQRLTWKAMNARRALMAERRRADLQAEGHPLERETGADREPDEILIRTEDERRIAKSIAELNEDEREILRMYALDLPRAEMAQEMQIKEPALRQKLRRALAKLRDEVRK